MVPTGRPKARSAAVDRTRKVTRVAIDPGHGGSDPGATGSTGLQEKDIALDIARRAAVVLARVGIDVMLTRDRDTTLALEDRSARANQFGADLFVSVHCNASDYVAKRGVETYVLDTVSDSVAARVAERENAANGSKNGELGALLASMRLVDHRTRSTKFAELLQKASIASIADRPGDTRAVDGGVHRAAFNVLVGAQMPSVLYETGYLSNPAQERLLATVEYRQRFADAIANAVRAYRAGF